MGVFQVFCSDNVVVKGNDYPIDNPKGNVLIITGMNEYSARYAPFAASLNEAGYSVYVLDHLGQGENVKKAEEQEIVPHGAWKKELEALSLKAKQLKESGLPLTLMGHSMGSFSVQAYLETYPDTIDKAIIMGSNGKNNLMAIKFGWMLSKMRAKEKNWNKEDKLMENASLGPYTKAVKNHKTDVDWLSYNEDNVKAYIADPYCGHFDTYGFYYEFMSGMKELYKKKNLENVSENTPILIVSGEEDPVGANGKGPKSLKKMYDSLGVKDVTLILYPHMRHEILNEVERATPIKDIVDFLNK